MRYMIRLPLLLALLCGQALGHPGTGSGNRCFTSSLTGKESLDACCSHVTTGTGDLDGTTFDYMCNTYVGPLNEFEKGNFHNVYTCGKECADTPECAAAVWSPDLLRCWYTTEAHAERISGTSNYITIDNKRPTADRPPPVAGDCQTLVDEAAAGCENKEKQKCDGRIKNQAQSLREECDQKSTDTCDKEKAQALKQFQEDQASKDDKNRQDQQKLRDEVERLRQQIKDQQGKTVDDDENRRNQQKLQDEVERLRQQIKDQQGNDANDDENRRNLQKLQDEAERLRQQLKDQQEKAADEDENRRIQQLQDEVERLRQQIKDQNSGNKPKPQPSGSSDTSRRQIPSEKEFKCPEFDGKEYTVLGVTYKVFCGYHPKSRDLKGGRLHRTDLEFLMAMCSVDRNCQGIKTKTGAAEIALELEFPPTQKTGSSRWWSIIPISKKSDTSAMVPDPFSQPPGGTGAPGTGGGARCPSIDGEILQVGGKEFQVNCRRTYNVKLGDQMIARSLRQCLISCTIEEHCQGVRYTRSGCWYLSHHETLERNTPKSELPLSPRDDAFVAMLTAPRDSNDRKKV